MRTIVSFVLVFVCSSVASGAQAERPSAEPVESLGTDVAPQDMAPQDVAAFLERLPPEQSEEFLKVLAEALRSFGVAAREGVDLGSMDGQGQSDDSRGIFQDCPECPEVVVLEGENFALGRHEVTVGQYRAFVSATDRSEYRCTGGGSWQEPPYPIGFSQKEEHPVRCISWHDAREYVSWLSEKTEHVYRLPTETEWKAAARSIAPERAARCYEDSTGRDGPCAVDSDGSDVQLLDMFGNLWEWTADCREDKCGVRGGAWDGDREFFLTEPHAVFSPDDRSVYRGFRVLRVLN